MRRLIDLILVIVAASLLLLIVARWVLPAIGLPGVDYETAHTVVKLASFMMLFVIMSLATPWLYQRRHEFIKLRRHPKIWYADGWEDFFLGRKANREETGIRLIEPYKPYPEPEEEQQENELRDEQQYDQQYDDQQ